MTRAFGILGLPVGDLAAKRAAKAAGCTHAVVQATWDQLQPAGPSKPLAPAAVAALRQEYADARTAGLTVMLEVALQYPPAWALEHVEPFVDQTGNVYRGADPGKRVANWQWTALGRTYVNALIRKVGVALGAKLRAQTVDVKIGGGYYGELHYPPSALPAAPFSWWGYGPSMQTGKGLAAGLTRCPVPGYRMCSGDPASDRAFADWYLDGLADWSRWLVAKMRAAGWPHADYHLALSGVGVRSNVAVDSAYWQQGASAGEDPQRIITALADDPRLWPYCTYVNPRDNYDGPAGPRVDSDLAAWEKVNTVAAGVGRDERLWGENTGGESAADLAAFRTPTPVVAAPYADPPSAYFGSPAASRGFSGLFWLDWQSLNDGNPAHAQLADLAAFIDATL